MKASFRTAVWHIYKKNFDLFQIIYLLIYVYLVKFALYLILVWEEKMFNR